MSEQLLCYFVTWLVQEGIALFTIKTYLAAIRHAQIFKGFPEPRESSSLPRLCLLQNDVRRVRAKPGVPQNRRLPTTLPPLLRLRPLSIARLRASSYEELLL